MEHAKTLIWVKRAQNPKHGELFLSDCVKWAASAHSHGKILSVSPESWHGGSKASVTASGVGNEDWSAHTLPLYSVYCTGALHGAENSPATCFPSPFLPLVFFISFLFFQSLFGFVGFALYLEPDMHLTSSGWIMPIHHCAMCTNRFKVPAFHSYAGKQPIKL